MAVEKYNPKRITGSWKGTVGAREFAVQFSGFMDGTFVTAEYDEAQTTKKIGAQGDAAVILNCNKGAKVVITLMQGADINTDLSELVPDGKRNYLPVGTLTIEDLNGTTLVKAAEAWIEKMAKIEYAKDLTPREWTFDTGEADIRVGAAGDF
jgi:hypothetical protein